MSEFDLAQLTRAVQHNCDVADARHAGDYTLCIYLLKMREYFRWERRLPLTAPLAKDEVGAWLTEREARWERLVEADFVPLTVAAHDFDPFANEAINQALQAHGLVYSGGLGRHARPHFFLAHCLRVETYNDYSIYVSSRELARDLTAPPAMARGRSIYIRRESLRRMIWEKLEEWHWKKQDNALSRALQYYEVDKDPERALDAITDKELESVVLHEIGEIRAGQMLGEEWHDMLTGLPRSSAEVMARAVRDHLADCLSTLPALLEAGNPAPLHFYFGNLHAMRKQLFPELNRAYKHWVEHNELTYLQEVTDQGSSHWYDVAECMLWLYRKAGANSMPEIEQLIENSRL